MDRLDLDQQKVEEMRDLLREPEAGHDQPCPGSVLKQNDDIEWLGFIRGRVLWGHPDPLYFYVYTPEVFGIDGYAALDVTYVDDRAPADPQETPMPLYPEAPSQQLAVQSAQQADGLDATKPQKPKPSKEEVTAALTKLLQSLPKDVRKNAREYIRKHRSDITLPEG